MTTPALFRVITVHCFRALAGCKHTVSGTDVQEVHDRMEEHYATAHAAYIASVTGGAA